MKPTGLVILAATALAPAWAAPAAKLEVQSPIIFDVREDGKSSTYSAAITVTASGPVPKVDFEASPMVGQDKAAGSVIPAANVTLGGLSFPAAGTRTVAITFASVPRPGKYAGTLTLKGGNARATVDLTLALHPRAAVKATAESQTFSLINCTWRATCYLGEMITPKALQGDHRFLGLDSSTGEVLHVDHVTANLDGEKTQTSLNFGAPSSTPGPRIPAAALAPVVSGIVPTADAPQVTFDVPADLLALGRSYATLTVTREAVPADRYRGVLRIFLKETEDPVMVPFTLDVRDGPLIAALLLSLGIIVGRKLQAQSTPEAQLRASAMESYHLLQDEIVRLRDDRSKAVLHIELEVLKRLIVANPPDKAQFEALRDSIGRKVLELERVFDLRDYFSGAPALVQDAIDKILQGDFSAAETAIEKLQAAVQAPVPQPRMLALAALQPTPPKKAGQKLAVGVGALAGTRWDRAELDYHWRRPLLGVLLLGLLWFIGFQSLYVNGSATFGSGGVFDYVPLFLWGLSADIAQRTLQNLPAVKGS